jgi:hypothetical protein
MGKQDVCAQVGWQRGHFLLQHLDGRTKVLSFEQAERFLEVGKGHDDRGGAARFG